MIENGANWWAHSFWAGNIPLASALAPKLNNYIIAECIDNPGPALGMIAGGMDGWIRRVHSD
jgi:hypothetical protein